MGRRSDLPGFKRIAMADWATVGVAVVAASGPLVGVWLKGRFDDRVRARERRDNDAALLREKLHSLMVEIDRIQQHFTTASLDVLRHVALDGVELEKREPVSFATLRTLIGIHFPECAAHLEEFDEKDKLVLEFIVTELKNKSDVKTLGAIATSKRAEIFGEFAQKVRADLNSAAASIGVTTASLSTKG